MFSSGIPREQALLRESKAPRTSPEKWTFLSLASCSAPSFHTGEKVAPSFASRDQCCFSIFGPSGLASFASIQRGEASKTRHGSKSRGGRRLTSRRSRTFSSDSLSQDTNVDVHRAACRKCCGQKAPNPKRGTSLNSGCFPLENLDGRSRAIVIAESLARVIAAIRIASVRWSSYIYTHIYPPKTQDLVLIGPAFVALRFESRDWRSLV